MVGLAPHRLAVEAVDLAVDQVAVEALDQVAVMAVAVAGEGRRHSGQRQRMMMPWGNVESAASAEWWATGVSAWAGWGTRPLATARAPTAFSAGALTGALARDYQWAVPPAEGTGRQLLQPA